MWKRTEQRRIIYDVLSGSDTPLSAPQICERARQVCPHLGLATVYRTLKSFQEAGLAECVEIPGVRPRYQLVRDEHHHHFYCWGCSTVFNVEGCPQGLCEFSPNGFLTCKHDVILYGWCASCQEAE